MAEKIKAQAQIATGGTKPPTKITGWMDVPLDYDATTFVQAVELGLAIQKKAMIETFAEHTKGKTYDAIERTWK